MTEGAPCAEVPRRKSVVIEEFEVSLARAEGEDGMQ